ncbi:glycoside hydrolase family protein [Ensifer sp. P24N7]|uniref:glycoside hydrolase family protein n=1 Tax=Sinorhizobium sp. P24N7 TaxID=3348358 RepID=UPI0035F4C951
MANRRLDPVSYRRFEAQPLLAEGLLSVARDNGDLERKVAMGLARVADEFGRRADRQAQRAGELAGARDAMAGAPIGATVTSAATDPGATGSVTAAPSGVVTTASGSAVDLAKSVLRKEEGFRETPYFDVNAHRVGYGSDTTVLADGRVVRVRPGMRITRDDAERDLDHRLSNVEGARARQQLGDLWNTLPANVQAGLLSVAYNYGSLPEGVISAARSGIDAIASAVAGLSSNPERRQREAALIRAGGGARGDAYSRLPSASSVAPISVTPISDPVTVTPGRAGTFRPTGRDTVYGRAYDVAGTRTYLEMADLAMVENQRAIFEAYKDDPAKLRQALDEGLEADLRDNVFEEIAPEYSLAYRKRASNLLEKAESARRERELMQNRVDFLGRMEELENQKSQQLAGIDFSNPSAGAELADLQASIDAHWDSAVARGVVDLDDAERFKRQSRSDATVGFYVRQAATMPAEDIKSMRARMTEDYAAGNLAGVSADDWDKIEKGLAGAESARRTQDEKANADFAKRGEDLAKRVARGLPVTAEDLARFQLDAGTAPKGKEIATSTLARMRISEAIRTQPIGAVEKNVKALLGDGATSDDVDFARRTIAEHRKDLQTDPLGVAERFGVLPVSPGLPLDGDIDPASVAGAFAERINAADAAAKHFGVQPKFFRPGEAEAIEAAVKADPSRGLDIAAGLVSAAGGNTDKVFRELGETAPAVALSGGLIASGGNRQAALDLISGFGKTPDGKAYTDMPNTKRLPLAQAATGTALAFTPDQVNRLDQAAASIARKRLYDAGIDPKKDDAKPIYERAYQEAAGASFANGVQFGGIADYDRGLWYSPQKVLLPPTVRADRFPQLMEALTDKDVGEVKAKNGRTWTAKDFQKAMPVAVRGGFAFALGDVDGSAPMFIADENGQPVVLDLEALRPVLEPRVPGAYR